MLRMGGRTGDRKIVGELAGQKELRPITQEGNAAKNGGT